MIRHILGELSLSISTFVYLFWLLPQICHNFKRQSTQGLSQSFHAILFVGYCFDLIYGFGLNMQWQYRLVTIVGLCSLCMQHLQIAAKPNRYRSWINIYCSKDFCAAVNSMISVLNELSLGIDDAIYYKVKIAFADSVCLENEFWEDAYSFCVVHAD